MTYDDLTEDPTYLSPQVDDFGDTDCQKFNLIFV